MTCVRHHLLLPCLQLKVGNAEVFGTELPLGEQLALQGQKIAIFTWGGCTVQLSTPEATLETAIDVVYDSDDTPMSFYLNVHDTLENRRKEANDEGKGHGPRTIVVGPTDVGKSSLCRLLLNWAVRSGWGPTMVDLDIGQGSITAPGSVGATPVESPIDIEEGLPVEVPLVYFFGSPSPTDNLALYRYIVERLAAVLNKRASLSPPAGASGMVINTMGFIDGAGYDLLLHSIEALKADVVLVLGQDRLFSQLQSALRSQQHISVVKLPKSGGVVTRPSSYRRQARVSRAYEYFYGPRHDLNPIMETVPFDQLQIYRIGGGIRAPSSGVLPVGAESQADPLKVSPVTNINDILNCMLAVSHADSPEHLLSVNVAGFLYAVSIDARKDPPTVTYLVPCPGPLPGKYLLLGAGKMLFPEQG
eukprot:jgi/Astpho2/7429/e_gw1.00114.56.1_t